MLVLMSNPTRTSVLSSPAYSYSSHALNQYSHLTSGRKTPNKSQRLQSRITSSLNPWNRHNYHGSWTLRPQQLRQPPVLNPLLDHHHQTNPLEYDLSLNPSHTLVTHQRGYSQLSVEQLNAPATNPSTRSMSITCHSLPWTIHISNSSDYITVNDVLESIYGSLRLRARKADWERLSAEDKRRVRDAWEARCRRQNSLQQRVYEESQGLRRVDFLKGNLAFKGLTRMSETTRSDEYHLVLHVGRVRRKVKFRANS